MRVAVVLDHGVVTQECQAADTRHDTLPHRSMQPQGRPVVSPSIDMEPGLHSSCYFLATELWTKLLMHGRTDIHHTILRVNVGLIKTYEGSGTKQYIYYYMK